MTYPITSVPPPPKRKKYLKVGLLTAAFVATAAISCGVGSTISNSSDAPTTVPPSSTAPKDDQPNRSTPKKTNPERDDLVSFKIDDRSIGGSFTNVWVAFTIQNHSSEKSDYTWDWEAINSKGERIANGTELVSNVLPKQTSKGSSPTTLDTANVKLHITDFERTASL
jgi:hypothetical protein